MNPGHIGAQGPVCSRPQRADILWGGPNHKICSHTQGPLSPSRLQVRPGSEESGARAPSAADLRPTPTLHHCPGALSEARPRPLPPAAKQTPTSGALSRRDVGGFVLRPPSPPGLDVRPLRETMSRKAPHFSLVTFPFLLWPPGDSALHNSVVTLLAFPPRNPALGVGFAAPPPILLLSLGVCASPANLLRPGAGRGRWTWPSFP